MKTVLDDLLESLPDEVAPVRHVLAGAHWTVVCITGAGMAATLMPEKPHGHARVHEVGRLHEKPARALAEMARSSDLLEASIGVAAMNSLLTVDESKARELNAADVLASRGAGRTVALIGRFPFVDRLRPAVGQLWVIEQHPLEGEYPAEHGQPAPGGRGQHLREREPVPRAHRPAQAGGEAHRRAVRAPCARHQGDAARRDPRRRLLAARLRRQRRRLRLLPAAYPR